MKRRIRIAVKLKRVAERRGFRCSFKLAYRIVAAAEDTHTPVAVLAGLVEKESAYQFIFGHDAGGLYPGERVTRWRYESLRNTLKAGHGGANGVGYVQVTYPPFIIGDGSLWRPKHNLRWGARNLNYESAASLNAYNGDPTGIYGHSLLAIIGEYRNALH